jgi:hypothetical protein
MLLACPHFGTIQTLTAPRRAAPLERKAARVDLESLLPFIDTGSSSSLTSNDLRAFLSYTQQASAKVTFPESIITSNIQLLFRLMTGI